MIFFLAILSLIFVLPIAATVVWQRRSRASWTILLFALAAFAVNYAVSIPLDRWLPEAMPFLDADPSISPRLWLASFLVTLTHGLIREGIRWLTFRYAATNVRSWQAGVMFGLGYACLAVLVETTPLFSDLGAAANQVPDSSAETMPDVPLSVWFMPVILFTLYVSVVQTIFNVGTALTVMFSVQRRNLWLFLAAVLLYAVYFVLPPIVGLYFPETQVNGFDSPLHWLAVTLPLAFLVALLPFLLLYRLHKSGQSDGRSSDDRSLK